MGGETAEEKYPALDIAKKKSPLRGVLITDIVAPPASQLVGPARIKSPQIGTPGADAPSASSGAIPAEAKHRYNFPGCRNLTMSAAAMAWC